MGFKDRGRLHKPGNTGGWKGKDMVLMWNLQKYQPCQNIRLAHKTEFMLLTPRTVRIVVF